MIVLVRDSFREALPTDSSGTLDSSVPTSVFTSDCVGFDHTIPVQVSDLDKLSKYQAKTGTKLRTVKVKVDSGAGVSVANKKTFGDYQIFATYESERGMTYTSACGGKIPDQGIRFPYVKTKDGLTRALSMRVAEVKTPLLAVFDMMHKDNKVVFDLGGS